MNPMQLVTEIETVIVERGKINREELLRLYFEVGELIETRCTETGEKVTALVNQLGKTSQLKEKKFSTRSLWKAVGIFDWCQGDFEKVYTTDHGVNITFSKLCRIIWPPKEKDPKEKTAHDLVMQFQRKNGRQALIDFVTAAEGFISESGVND